MMNEQQELLAPIMTINQKFEAFSASVIPKNATEEQREWMMMAFFGGAVSILQIEWDASNRFDNNQITIEEMCAVTQSLHDECNAFHVELEVNKAMLLGKVDANSMGGM